ncbi:transcriptional regulator [Rhizobium deserti]|uniref:Transcriptional regulator n=1 Tax=Rhizobium deserti TaxID=2547961 RepID=A0A4R5UMC6_9HYPH|nr:transcriptional regulator [Rhizobium deserti]TDK38919.1 transcriptional regulator [Rhizobium deserti]
MLSLSKIVVIAADAGLRHSLTFALEVEGYQVEAHETWVECRPSTGCCLCKIVDDQVIHNDSEAMRSFNDDNNVMILLVDGLSPVPPAGRAKLLVKPFDGSDLVQMVRSLTCAA